MSNVPQSNASQKGGERRLSNAGQKGERRMSRLSQSGDPEPSYGLHLWTGSGDAAEVLQSRDAAAMEKVLFGDDRRAGDFLKTLINASGLRSAHDSLQKRVLSCEERCVELYSKTSHSTLQEEFVTRKEYLDRVEGRHAKSILSYDQRLYLLEEGLAQQSDAASEQAKGLQESHEGLASQVQELSSTRQWLARVEQQALERHEHSMSEHAKAVKEQAATNAGVREELGSLRARLDQGEVLQARLQRELSEQKEFLFGEKLQEHFRLVVRQIMHEYVRKEELHQEASKAVQVIVDEVLHEQDRQKHEIERIVQHNRQHFAGLEEGMKKSNIKHVEDAKEMNHRIEDILNKVGLCATKRSLQEKETYLEGKFKQNEKFIKEVKKASGLKMEEFVTRLLEVQSVLSDHEHALQHQAEELLNRTTKYDLMLCEHRIDDCALRDKVDADVKELKSLTRWQSSKLEKLGAQQGLGGERHASRAPNKEGADTEEPTSGRRGSVASVVFSGAPPQDAGQHTGLLGDMREQLERVAQGVLGLSHLALRGSQQQAKSREERELREAELIHHLSCIVDWIVNKAAPADWDKAKFISLVTASSIPADVDRRRSTLLALARSAGPSQSTAAPSPSTMTLSMSFKEKQLDSREGDLDGMVSPEEEGFGEESTDEEQQTDQEEQEAEEQEGKDLKEERPARTGLAATPPVRPPSTRLPNPSPSPRVGAKRGLVTRSNAPGVPVARKQPVSMGGGFKGRLVRTRVVVQDTGESSTPRQSGTSPAEVLPRLFAMLEEEQGHKTF